MIMVDVMLIVMTNEVFKCGDSHWVKIIGMNSVVEFKTTTDQTGFILQKKMKIFYDDDGNNDKSTI